MGARWYVKAGAGLLGHPTLWPTAFGQLWRLRRRRWWAHRPFLPVPSADYLRFRMLTAYGDPDCRPEPADVATYLRWCRSWPHVTR